MITGLQHYLTPTKASINTDKGSDVSKKASRSNDTTPTRSVAGRMPKFLVSALALLSVPFQASAQSYMRGARQLTTTYTDPLQFGSCQNYTGNNPPLFQHFVGECIDYANSCGLTELSGLITELNSTARSFPPQHPQGCSVNATVGPFNTCDSPDKSTLLSNIHDECYKVICSLANDCTITNGTSTTPINETTDTTSTNYMKYAAGVVALLAVVRQIMVILDARSTSQKVAEKRRAQSETLIRNENNKFRGLVNDILKNSEVHNFKEMLVGRLGDIFNAGDIPEVTFLDQLTKDYKLFDKRDIILNGLFNLALVVCLFSEDSLSSDEKLGMSALALSPLLLEGIMHCFRCFKVDDFKDTNIDSIHYDNYSSKERYKIFLESMPPKVGSNATKAVKQKYEKAKLDWFKKENSEGQLNLFRLLDTVMINDDTLHKKVVDLLKLNIQSDLRMTARGADFLGAFAVCICSSMLAVANESDMNKWLLMAAIGLNTSFYGLNRVKVHSYSRQAFEEQKAVIYGGRTGLKKSELAVRTNNDSKDRYTKTFKGPEQIKMREIIREVMALKSNQNSARVIDTPSAPLNVISANPALVSVDKESKQVINLEGIEMTETETLGNGGSDGESDGNSDGQSINSEDGKKI